MKLDTNQNILDGWVVQSQFAECPKFGGGQILF